jgi:hypothetical protein
MLRSYQDCVNYRTRASSEISHTCLADIERIAYYRTQAAFLVGTQHILRLCIPQVACPVRSMEE